MFVFKETTFGPQEGPGPHKRKKRVSIAKFRAFFSFCPFEKKCVFRAFEMRTSVFLVFLRYLDGNVFFTYFSVF